MEISGLNKIMDAIGDAFSIFDFSFFISGAATLGFVMLDMHYYGHDGILGLDGWKGGVIFLLAIYICGLMSWCAGKFLRQRIIAFVRHDCNWMSKDLKTLMDELMDDKQKKDLEALDYPAKYTALWIKLCKDEVMTKRVAFVNRMWVMQAVFEGLIASWVVGLFVYFDGCLIGGWIHLGKCGLWFAPIAILFALIGLSVQRATDYAESQIKEVVLATQNK